jgi:uncharacterized protein YndB with AHSA1/START domain
MKRLIFLLGMVGCGDFSNASEARMWCGGHLCELSSKGLIESADSWHPDDDAVALVSADAELSRTFSDYGRCVRVLVIAKSPAGTALTVELTLERTGTTESRQIDGTGWQSHALEFELPESATVRLKLAKTGDGVPSVARFYPSNCRIGRSRRPSRLGLPF